VKGVGIKNFDAFQNSRLSVSGRFAVVEPPCTMPDFLTIAPKTPKFSRGRGSRFPHSSSETVLLRSVYRPGEAAVQL
jgi:hypothetical protein